MPRLFAARSAAGLCLHTLCVLLAGTCIHGAGSDATFLSTPQAAASRGRHLSETDGEPSAPPAVATANMPSDEAVGRVPQDTLPFFYTTLVYESGELPSTGIRCDGGVQAAVDAACCRAPFRAASKCPGTPAVMRPTCPELVDAIICCANGT
eukprot:jgi/Ulvmu1/9504/UM052_0077.1